ASRVAVAREIEAQVRQLPGVQQVGWSYGIPPAGGAISLGDWESDAPGVGRVHVNVDRYSVGDDFFALYGIPLLRGRTFQDGEADGTVIVGERLARTLWPGLDPIGRTFGFHKERFQVIGVVRELQLPSLDATLDRPEFYERFPGVGSYAMMSIRCAPCPDPARVRQRIAAAGAAISVNDVGALDDAYFVQLAQPRAAAALAFAFATIAAPAAAAGLFSGLSYAVRRRQRGFGIPHARGAPPAPLPHRARRVTGPDSRRRLSRRTPCRHSRHRHRRRRRMDSLACDCVARVRRRHLRSSQLGPRADAAGRHRPRRNVASRAGSRARRSRAAAERRITS